MRGRIRTIKPEAHLDEILWDLEQETGLPIFRAFTGLWTQADREGRFEWRPRALKSCVLPYWDGDFSRVLDALATRGFVVRYEVDGREYGVVRNFKKHQVINHREQESVLPPPPKKDTESQRVEHASTAREARVPGHALGEGKGREAEGNGKGTESKVLTAAAKTGRHISREKPASAAVAVESGEETSAEPVALSVNSELFGTNEAVAGPSPPSGAQEIPTKVPCPADLSLNHSQIEQLKMQIGLEPWAADELTARFVSKALADPTDCRTLVAWRKSLAVAVAGDWRDPRKKPTKPNGPTAAEIAEAQARREAGERHLAAERNKLAAQVTPEALAAAERGLPALGIRRPA